MKVVINSCFGCFSLSDAACLRLRELGNPVALAETMSGEKYPDSDVRGMSDFNCRDIPRNDLQLVQVVEELGSEANGGCADLSVVEVPDDADWEIREYDGNEHVAEKHRTWG